MEYQTTLPQEFQRLEDLVRQTHPEAEAQFVHLQEMYHASGLPFLSTYAESVSLIREDCHWKRIQERYKPWSAKNKGEVVGCAFVSGAVSVGMGVGGFMAGLLAVVFGEAFGLGDLLPGGPIWRSPLPGYFFQYLGIDIFAGSALFPLLGTLGVSGYGAVREHTAKIKRKLLPSQQAAQDASQVQKDLATHVLLFNHAYAQDAKTFTSHFESLRPIEQFYALFTILNTDPLHPMGNWLAGHFGNSADLAKRLPESRDLSLFPTAPFPTDPGLFRDWLRHLKGEERDKALQQVASSFAQFSQLLGILQEEDPEALKALERENLAHRALPE